MLQPAQSLLNTFSEDTIHISLRHLLQVISKHGWTCTKVFNVTQYATDASHYLAILNTGHPICDCMMGTNLGLPCRHFYSILRATNSTVQFHLGLFNRRYCVHARPFTLLILDRRWLTDPAFDITTTQAVTIGRNRPADEAAVIAPQPLPLLHRQSSPAPNTRTLPPKVIHHQAMTKFKDVLRYVHTEEELQDLSADIEALV